MTTQTMHDLYDAMKWALRVFDLSFHQMREVTVKIDAEAITFTYQNMDVIVHKDYRG